MIVLETEPCIIPGYEPPANGEVPNLIGAELFQLANGINVADTITENNTVFLLDSTQVLIEVITEFGKHDSALALLQTPNYGMNSFIDNGDTTFIIT